MAILHEPYDSTAGLDAEALHTESQFAILATSHPLAGAARLRMADVIDLPELARWPEPDGTYLEGPGVEVHNLTQLFQMIALGRAVAVMPEVVAVPVVDAPKMTTVIAWPPHSRSRAVADLVRVATGFSSPVHG
ncbi:LysR substrate binding domain-containing protein [Lentzea atacamensis]|uniref:LysR substrate binding domain-containing protein n=2 Tax=Lentzea TaxID=165301 RepID=A0A316IC01_9PSEU|nr:LysR substrate-binding domain-containing protein [Lentzea atacamensis]PWK90741.1 LysR substrate binding domain-containing protein [Lentzea atacamensis]